MYRIQSWMFKWNSFFNIKHNLLFFRISLDIIPFASHQIFSFDVQKIYAERLHVIGQIIKKNKVRIFMHPDQFVLLNLSNPTEINNRLELEHQADFFHCSRSWLLRETWNTRLWTTKIRRILLRNSSIHTRLTAK